MTPSWLALLGATVAAVGAVDVVLLEMGAGYFRTGYNGPLLASFFDRAIFVAVAACVDTAMILALWTPLCPLLRYSRLGGAQQAVVAVAIGGGVPVALDVIRYRIHHVLGDILDPRVLWELAGASISGSVAEMVSQAPATLTMALGTLGAVVILVGLAGRAQRRGLRLPEAPGLTPLLAAFVAFVVAAGALLAFAEFQAPRFAYGLNRKPSGALLRGIVEKVTDVDRDGTGLLARPPDPAPFDPDRHPWALDRPGNGIDENGLGGDLPLDFALPEPAPLGEDRGGRPHLLLIFLESFRGDLIGDREATPFLTHLADDGSATRHAYVHTPFTGPSREQLFSGSLTYDPGDPTLYDDFRQRGYRIGHFSGQDDTHADAIERLDLDRADVFYDARDDVERKTSRTTAAVSLQISWKTLLERVEAFLSEHDPDRPLLLYVNIVDAHFPYDHRELDRILDDEPLDRSEIHSGNAEKVRTAYRNAAANVDRAVEQLARSWWSRLGEDAAVLVTADHGQSFYENGMLGHGQSLRPEQTRVPFILWNIGGVWPEPLGLADVRSRLVPALSRNTSSDATRPRARFEADPEREVFLYLAKLDRPRLLGLQRLATLDVLELPTGKLRRYAGEQEAVTPHEPEVQRPVIWTWEALRNRQADAAKPR